MAGDTAPFRRMHNAISMGAWVVKKNRITEPAAPGLFPTHAHPNRRLFRVFLFLLACPGRGHMGNRRGRDISNIGGGARRCLHGTSPMIDLWFQNGDLYSNPVI